MYSNRPPPPAYPEKLTIALFGKRVQLKNNIGNMILNSANAFATASNNLVVAENNSFKVLITPDFFDEECERPDQQIIDLMAMSHPGPHLFILAIDSENAHVEKVVAQISKLQETFGERITAHLVIMLPDIESVHSLGHLKEAFNITLAVVNENVAMECKKWCPSHQSFLFDYKNYSRDVVTRRQKTLERRYNLLHHHGRAGAGLTSQQAFAADATLEHHTGNIFNIVLLGLTGTGKSASANTILAAGHSQQDQRQLFISQSSSMPVTTECDIRITKKPFGMVVRVVDTPDFFHEQLKNPQEQVAMCRKYCQPGQCVVLLVLQLSRFTDAERGILENLENKLNLRIRDNTIVLLTHGEDLKGSLEQFIYTHGPLRNIIEMCGHRYHVFNNNSKDTKQVIELIKKIPNYKNIFPKFTRKCLVC
ncbi:GTPase IMAP family member 8-like [Trachinotus anak]|uniref:GTPase IMAP family member 8-like n=1 Tax=Trachinotus anak TaxID=443729 RepID=UPI0039F1C876